MEFVREYVDGNGQKVRATVEVDTDGEKFERAILALVNKARGKVRKSKHEINFGTRATAFGGAVRVRVKDLP